MLDVLLLTVHLHDNSYHGTGDDLPAPARLFQALVAGAGISGPSVVEAYRDALEWLETLEPPTLAAPSMMPGNKVAFHVPLNDLDAKGGDIRRISDIRVEKLVTTRLIDANPEWLYAWDLSDEPDAMQHAKAVCDLAEHLYQFGRGEDMAWAWGEVIAQEELEARLSSYPGVVYRPTGGGRGTVLSCPTPGSFASLQARHRANGQRFITTGSGRAMKQAFQQPPKPRFVQVVYESPPERFVYNLCDDDKQSFLAMPLVTALPLTKHVRDGVAAKLQTHFSDAEIKKVFIGRQANGDDDGPVSQRVRIIPLPSIGHEHADLGIRRVLVEVPAECPFQANDVRWALSGLSLEGVHTAATPLLTQSPNDLMCRHYGITRKAQQWRTVTPAALPGWIWRGVRKLRSAEETSNEAALIVRQRAAEAVIKTLRFSGVRSRVEAVRVQREPFDRNGERADAFDAGDRFDRARLWHVEITFDSPVSGPLVIGDGRFLGLGVMAPAQEATGVFTADGRTVAAPVEDLAFAEEASEPQSGVTDDLMAADPEAHASTVASKSSAGAVGGAFVTPHAIQQFRERIKYLPDNYALAAILHSLRTAGPPRPTANGAAVYVRTKTPYSFRAILKPPPPDRELPAIVTILKG